LHPDADDEKQHLHCGRLPIRGKGDEEERLSLQFTTDKSRTRRITKHRSLVLEEYPGIDKEALSLRRTVTVWLRAGN
jgi:hypothetical protein